MTNNNSDNNCDKDSEQDFDLIIIGAGSVGSAAAFYAARAGLKCLAIDAYQPPHTEASHHGGTRIIRHAYGEGPRYVPLLLRAQALWNELNLLTHEKIFVDSGVLNAGHASSEFIQNAQLSAKEFNLNCQILTPEEVSQKWPEIKLPQGFLAVYEPDAGFLRSEEAIKHYLLLAEQSGAKLLTNCRVQSLSSPTDSNANGFTAVNTTQGEFRAKKVAVCSGTWVKSLLPELPVTPIRRVFAWHQADGRYSMNNKFPAFVIERAENESYYGFPAENDELKVGKHIEYQPINSPEERVPFGKVATDGKEVLGFLRDFLPGIGCCLYGASCTYDMSPDEDFIIDTLPNDNNVMVVTGLSGHGYKFASVLGETVMRFAQAEDPKAVFNTALAPFSLKRFNN